MNTIISKLSGIDGVLYYAPTLFKQAGLSSTQAAFFASGVSGLLNIACTIFIQPFQDRRMFSVTFTRLTLLLTKETSTNSRPPPTCSMRWFRHCVLYAQYRHHLRFIITYNTRRTLGCYRPHLHFRRCLRAFLGRREPDLCFRDSADAHT